MELSLVISQNTQQQQLNMSDVAVLVDGYDLSRYKQPLENMLWETLGVRTQSIEQQLTSNNTNDIVVDEFNNVASFECPMVVAVVSGDGSGKAFDHYNMWSRARTKLVVIDVDFSITKSVDIDFITWVKNQDNTFQKLPSEEM